MYNFRLNLKCHLCSPRTVRLFYHYLYVRFQQNQTVWESPTDEAGLPMLAMHGLRRFLRRIVASSSRDRMMTKRETDLAFLFFYSSYSDAERRKRPIAIFLDFHYYNL